jgi:TetR/AcrR family transcriptional repressor of nem operon
MHRRRRPDEGAGLTHGGFYAHFDSREALVIEAFRLCDGPLDRALAQARRADAAGESGWRTIVDSYLTGCIATIPAVLRRPDAGCGNRPREPKNREGVRGQARADDRHAADQIPDVPRKPRAKQAMATIATMMGTLVLARIAGSGAFSRTSSVPGAKAVLGGRRRMRVARKVRSRQEGCTHGAALTLRPGPVIASTR